MIRTKVRPMPVGGPDDSTPVTAFTQAQLQDKATNELAQKLAGNPKDNISIFNVSKFKEGEQYTISVDGWAITYQDDGDGKVSTNDKILKRTYTEGDIKNQDVGAVAQTWMGQEIRDRYIVAQKLQGVIDTRQSYASLMDKVDNENFKFKAGDIYNFDNRNSDNTVERGEIKVRIDKDNYIIFKNCSDKGKGVVTGQLSTGDVPCKIVMNGVTRNLPSNGVLPPRGDNESEEAYAKRCVQLILKDRISQCDAKIKIAENELKEIENNYG